MTTANTFSLHLLSLWVARTLSDLLAMRTCMLSLHIRKQIIPFKGTISNNDI